MVACRDIDSKPNQLFEINYLKAAFRRRQGVRGRPMDQLDQRDYGPGSTKS
jgi:hypothetical protein